MSNHSTNKKELRDVCLPPFIAVRQTQGTPQLEFYEQIKMCN